MLKKLLYTLHSVIFVLLSLKAVAQEQVNVQSYVDKIYNFGFNKEFDSAHFFSKKAMLIAKLSDNNLEAYVAAANARILFWETNTNKAKEQLTYYLNKKEVKDTTKVLLHLYIAEIYAYEENFTQALKHFVAAENKTVAQPYWKKKNTRLFSSYASMGEINQKLKNYKYAKNYYTKALPFSPSLGLKSRLLFSISSLYDEKENINKALQYTLRAINELKKSKTSLLLPTYYARVSQYYLKLKNADSAIYFAKKGLKDNTCCRIDKLNNNLGLAYKLKGNYSKSNTFYNKALSFSSSLEQKLKIYENLRDLNREVNKLDKALVYNDSVAKLKDSLYSLKVKQEVAEISGEFESNKKQLKIDSLNEKNIFNELLIQKQKRQIFLSGFLLIVLIGLVAVVIHFYKKQKSKKQLLQIKNSQLARTIENIKEKRKKKTTQPLEVIDKTKILLFIKEFIAREGYLNREITLQKIAKEAATNTSYFSKVINEEYEKSFSNFMNDLRISYTLERIQTDTSFKKLTIEAIAEKSGFTSTNTFYRAFKKNTGVTPSYYIKRLHSKN